MFRTFNGFLQQNTTAPFGGQQAGFVRSLVSVVHAFGTCNTAFYPQRVTKQIRVQSHRGNIQHMGGFWRDDLVRITKPVKLRLGDFEAVVRVGQQSTNTLAQQVLGQTSVKRHLQVQAWQQHINGVLFVNMQDAH